MPKDDFLWVEKYRPKTISDCILPSDLEESFSEFVEKGTVPNLILTGNPGSGKTTAAKALCEQTNTDYLMVNGSDEGSNIDTVFNLKKRSCLKVPF